MKFLPVGPWTVQSLFSWNLGLWSWFCLVSFSWDLKLQHLTAVKSVPDLHISSQIFLVCKWHINFSIICVRMWITRVCIMYGLCPACCPFNRFWSSKADFISELYEVFWQSDKVWDIFIFFPVMHHGKHNVSQTAMWLFRHILHQQLGGQKVLLANYDYQT